MELASELRMSKVMQLCAAIAPRGFVLPKHLNLMSSDAGNRAPCAGLIFTDPDDAVTQRKPTAWWRWSKKFWRAVPPAKHTRGLGIIHLRDIRRFRQLRPTMITICRLAVDPTPAQPVLVKSIPWRPD